MKKWGFFSILLTILLLTVSVYAKSDGVSKTYVDLNTKNIKTKFDTDSLKNIKMLCSYDYCDYIDMESIDRGLNTFTIRYLETISDDEIKNILKVKGVTITKVIFAN